MTAVAMPPGRSVYLPLALRLLKSAAGLGALCWSVGVWLSYTGAHSFAVAAGYGDKRAWLFPVTLDALALVAYVALLMLPAGARRYPGFVLVVTAGAGAAAQGYHQADMGAELAGWVRFAAGAWPMVGSLIAGHLVWAVAVRAVPTGLVSALRSLADQSSSTVYDEVERLDTTPDTMSVTDPDSDPEPLVSPPPRLAVSAARVHVPPSGAVTADVDRSAARPVGEAVALDESLLARVRSGELTPKAAADMAGCHPRTIKRRLEAA